MTMTLIDRIRDYLDALDVDTLITMHNETADADDRVYEMGEAEDVLYGIEPLRVAAMVYYGDFCPARSYFWFNGYGNLESSDFLPDVVSTWDLARHIVEDDDDLGDDEIRDILDEYETEEEDDDDDEEDEEA